MNGASVGTTFIDTPLMFSVKNVTERAGPIVVLEYRNLERSRKTPIKAAKGP